MVTRLNSLRRAYLKRREQLRTAMFAAGPACDDTTADLFTAPDVFESEPDTVRQEREAAAKRICRTCPARPQCLAYALDIRPTEGVWAGLSVEEIRALSLFGIAPNVEQEVA
ncbi:WhiB family transcriptional regulator [Streptosporangium sp. NPDC049046]|uniref:WhiB family transcriptional regulator n=1 Tax=Streptosporangium sp. NPDC049046 TaxID=3155031 RepID=UPI00343AACB9